MESIMERYKIEGLREGEERGLNRVEWGHNISISIEHNDTPIPILQKKKKKKGKKKRKSDNVDLRDLPNISGLDVSEGTQILNAFDAGSGKSSSWFQSLGTVFSIYPQTVYLKGLSSSPF